MFTVLRAVDISPRFEFEVRFLSDASRVLRAWFAFREIDHVEGFGL